MKSNQDDKHISVDDYLRGGRRSSDTASIQAFRRMMSGNGQGMSTPTNDEHRQPQSQQEFRYNNSNFNPTLKLSPYIHDLGKPDLTLKVPVNVNKVLIADIDHDGLNELILARTDRILHAFQLVPSDVMSAPFDHMYKGIRTPSVSSLSPSASSTSLTGLSQSQQTPQKQQKRTASMATVNTTNAQTQTASTNKDENVPTSTNFTNKKINLLDKNMWVFDGQITSLCTTTHPDRPNEPLLLVAQPGNTFTIIDQDGKRFNRDFTPQSNNNPTTAATEPSSHTAQQSSNEDESRIKSFFLNNETPGDIPVNVDIYKDPSTATCPTDFERSNYVVKNWPILDTNGGTNNDDVIDDEIESGAVATEIVIGKRHLQFSDSLSTSEVGMLSMDGKYNMVNGMDQETNNYYR